MVRQGTQHKAISTMPEQAKWLPTSPSEKQPWWTTPILSKAVLSLGGFTLLLGIVALPYDRMIAGPLLFVGCLLHGASWYLSSLRRSRVTVEDDGNDLIEDPDDPDVFLVKIKIVQDGIVTGEDRGAAYIEDNAFVFAGEKTSFIVGGQDLISLDLTRKHYNIGSLKHASKGFGLAHPTRLVWIGIDQIPAKDHMLHRPDMAKLIDKWVVVHHATQSTRQYPPLTVEKHVAHRHYLEQNAVVLPFIFYAILPLMIIGIPYALISLPVVFFVAVLAAKKSRTELGALAKVMREEGQSESKRRGFWIRRK